jgi:hypothetical protein
MGIKYLNEQERKEWRARMEAEMPWLFDAASWEEARKERDRQENRPPNPYEWPKKPAETEPDSKT